VEAGKMPVDPGEVPLDEVRAYLEQSFRHVAEQKALAFDVRMAPALPPALHTDVSRLQQILKNLVSNALKFTAQGAVTVTVDRAGPPHSLAGEAIAFSVEDTGIGIAREKQKLIFEAFQQADGTTSRKYGGTGLGLTISREIARLLGGTIEVESTPGAGSTFTLVLPLRYAGPEPVDREPLGPAPGTEPPLPLPSDARFEGRVVLLADDDIRNVFAINSVLESRQMKVLHAENGREAIRLLEANPAVDLVLMDTMMPEMDGLSAIQEIRRQERFARLPIISLTAKAMKGDREKAIDAGASDYVAKPVDPDRLLAVMYGWLQRERDERA
jgi:CheY-like chemotaxis protein/two-component sensor histidine kinase